MITPFNPSVISRAIEIVKRCRADEELFAAISPKGPGRPPSANTLAFLVGALLAVQWKGSLVIRDVHRVLTQRLPLDVQHDLGVRRDVNGRTRVMTEKDLYRTVDAIGRHLEYGQGSRPDLDDEERQRRRNTLHDLLHNLLAVTLPDATTTSRAIDGTGIWSYARAPRSAPADMLKRDNAGEPLHEPEAASSGDEGRAARDETEGAGEKDSPKRATADPDATHGVKTRKDGQRETYFGYELHALVRAPDDSAEFDFIPLFETFELTPAGADIVAPSLGLLDRSKAMGNTVTDLLADRHYSYKAEDRWYFELLDRGIRQHVDLHPNDQGFRDYNGMKLAAGWMHCPSTPDHLGRIDIPGPNATAEAKQHAANLIDQRQQYSMRRVARLQTDSGARWECPALDGRVGCPLREGSVEVAQLHGLPIIVEPPDAADAPACCTQRTVTTGRDAQPKIEQEHYWGSEKWRRRYNARTYVEGAFGNMKNQSTENVERGFFKVGGLAKVTFMVGIALVAHNLRMLRGNTELFEPGEGDPLLQRDADTHGFMFLTEDEARLITERRATRMETAASA